MPVPGRVNMRLRAFYGNPWFVPTAALRVVSFHGVHIEIQPP